MFIFEVLQPLAPELFWILCAAFVIAFLLAFSVGANDVSNSFGTSVGSRVLTVTQACILATVFEVAGATLLGYSVCDTFRRKMYDVDLYEGAQKELMLGALACLIGSALWNILATALKMPISGTHSIVGATIGFSVVSRGWDSIRWTDMARIVASWFASPLLSGAISSVIYVLISKTIISKVDPLKYGLKALPLFYGATIFINVASIVIDGPEVLGLNTLPWYAGLFIALVAATVAICCVAIILVPRLKREILGDLISGKSPALPPVGGIGLDTLGAGKGGASSAAAYDNVTFRPDQPAVASATRPDEAEASPTDEQGRRSSTLSRRRRRAPPKPKRELSQLDPAQLEREQRASAAAAAAPASAPPQIERPVDAPPAGDDAQPTASSAQVAGSSKPTVAPKPAHLRRQAAEDKQPQEQLDEIELGGSATSAGDLEGGSRATSGASKSAAINMGARDGATGGPSPFRANEASALYTFSGERHEVAKLFSSLQILTACFASFAHGTNDVSNAVAPLIPIWNIYTTGRENIHDSTQIWILAFGSIGICTGLWAWGRAVMATISDGLTKITPSKGFSIELGAAISVLVATKLGLPISTTHCKVGSLVIVGFVSSKFLSQDNLLSRASQQMTTVDEQGKQELEIAPDEDAVDWKLFGNIALTWISTVPLAAAASALVMVLLRWLAL